MKTSTVYFFTCNNQFNIIAEIKKDSNNFECYGTGKKAFLTALKEVEKTETVYQIKITTDNIEVLYKY
jgi:protein associated with RNAse G/E